ncbi:MAG TPA: metallophosphoesterase family protein [Thermoanaerobaculia bacterium]
MRALVLSDIHGNLEALRAVMSRVRRKKFDQIVCLGDFVGYGAHPNQVIDMMREQPGTKLYVRGNHDRVAAGLEEGQGFNAEAREAAVWTRGKLSARNRRFLENLPVGPVPFENVLICHGSPYHEDEYVFTERHAAQVLSEFEARFVLHGHTHLASMFWFDGDDRLGGTLVPTAETFRLDPAMQYLINPGSVGQPRDRNPEASFVIFDSERLTAQFFRVPYNYEKTQKAILKAGLPRVLADRLAFGT